MRDEVVVRAIWIWMEVSMVKLKYMDCFLANHLVLLPSLPDLSCVLDFCSYSVKCVIPPLMWYLCCLLHVPTSPSGLCEELTATLPFPHPTAIEVVSVMSRLKFEDLRRH